MTEKSDDAVWVEGMLAIFDSRNRGPEPAQWRDRTPMEKIEAEHRAKNYLMGWRKKVKLVARPTDK